jgi:hypothetical protein
MPELLTRGDGLLACRSDRLRVVTPGRNKSEFAHLAARTFGMGSGPPIPICGRGICTTNIRCKRRDLNLGQQSLTRGSSRVTLLRLGLPLSLAHESPRS